jgi:hypothetical protein
MDLLDLGGYEQLLDVPAEAATYKASSTTYRARGDK